MSGPRTKRQFAGAASDPTQRHITYFFNKTGDGATTPASASNTSSTSLSSPLLPAQVQANLLSVGMRVRKSVPEGYKTGSSCGTFSLWADANADLSRGSENKLVSAYPPPPSAATSRELPPFCGIHKVGGLGTQPDYLSEGHATAIPPCADFDIPAFDDVPSLASSQASTASSASAPAPMAAAGPATTNRKRYFPAAEEDAADVPAVYGSDWLDGEVSPRSLAPAGWASGRAIAVPRRSRSRRKGIAAVLGGGEAAELAELGQENLMAVDDFEDAAFLDFRAAVGGDLEMGGLE